MKKKLTKRDKARQAALRAAQLKQQQELERQRLIQEQKERLEAQRKAALEKEAQDNSEHDLRIIQLDDSCKFIAELHKKYLQDERKDMEQEQVCTLQFRIVWTSMISNHKTLFTFSQ